MSHNQLPGKPSFFCLIEFSHGHFPAPGSLDGFLDNLLRQSLVEPGSKEELAPLNRASKNIRSQLSTVINSRQVSLKTFGYIDKVGVGVTPVLRIRLGIFQQLVEV